MSRWIWKSTVAGATLLLATEADAAEWWVDQAAAAGGDGSQGQPFQTINEVKSVLQTGDTVYIRDGTYQETVDFWHVPEGTDELTIIRAEDGHSPVIDGGGVDGFVIQTGETPRMSFRGLTVRNGSTAFSIYYSDHCEVIDCITESVGGAVSFYHSSHGHVAGSTLEGSVSGKESDGTVIEDNEIWGSGAEGITLHADSKNCRYSRNVVHDNTSVNIYLDSISDTLVESNLVYMSDPAAGDTVGIMLADESYENVTSPVLRNITVINNVVIGNESGIRFWDGHFPGESGLRNVLIANNTVVNNRTSAIKWDAGAHEDAIVRNNIFAAETGRGLLLLQANSVTGVTLDHNLWYLPDVDRPFLWDETTYDHAGWTGATGHGDGDVTADPMFAAAWDLPVHSLLLVEGSLAIDSGAAIAEVSHDFDGGARPVGAGYDMGAFEHGAGPDDGGDTGDTGGDGSTGSGQDGGTGSSADGSGADGTDGTDTDSSGADETGGCGCRPVALVAARHEHPQAGLVGLALLLRRRRRRDGLRAGS